jgi:hypothetical protein
MAIGLRRAEKKSSFCSSGERSRPPPAGKANFKGGANASEAPNRNLSSSLISHPQPEADDPLVNVVNAREG